MAAAGGRPGAAALRALRPPVWRRCARADHRGSIPRFLSESVVKLAHRQVPAIQSLAPGTRLSPPAPTDLDWNMSFNTYRATQQGSGPSLEAFPFHVDTPTAGEVTMILGLMSGATLELAHESDPENKGIVSVEMEPGGLLVLAGEARHNWRHRCVLPAGEEAAATTAKQEARRRSRGRGRSEEEEDIRRMSLVLGCAAK